MQFSLVKRGEQGFAQLSKSGVIETLERFCRQESIQFDGIFVGSYLENLKIGEYFYIGPFIIIAVKYGIGTIPFSGFLGGSRSKQTA